MIPIKLTIQHFEGCPNGPAMIANAKQTAAMFPGLVEYEEQLIETNEDAAKYSFRGSPTLLINGLDFEGMFKPLNPSISCRFYAGGVPDAGKIAERIEEMLAV
jgi:hypothetical protein